MAKRKPFRFSAIVHRKLKLATSHGPLLCVKTQPPHVVRAFAQNAVTFNPRITDDQQFKNSN